MASQCSNKKRPNKSKKRSRFDSEEFERINSLPWNSTISEEDDAFSFLIGSNDVEGGGFLSLEEIDESEYNLDIAKPSGGSEKKGKTKPKKQKIDTKNEELNDEAKGESKADTEEVEKETKQKKNKKKKQKKKKDKINKDAVNNAEGNEESAAVTDEKDDREQDSVDETEYYAWNELRLHSLLMKSIYALKFKEPTPIQKMCIPAAAHQGKDVVGAAETGSGKTLAFGLPILQRLLEEREKAERQLTENEEMDEKVAPTGLLRALIITPTRELALQVTDHLKEAARHSNFRVVPIVGGMSSEKQERLLRTRPEIVVGTPGRLWELMSGGEIHLVELHSLSFFVLDEADRMIENGHFHELQSIVDMLPMASKSTDGDSQKTHNCETVSSVQRKKRQTFVFSATIALSADFRKKLKRGSQKSKANDELNSIETLSERAGMRADAAIIDLTNASILANKLEESFIDCSEEDKDGYLYYILSVHGQGRTIVFCTSIAALRHISSLLRILGVNIWTLHAQMQQRARLKAIDRFRSNEHGILIATDVAARGLDIPGVRTVIHYQLPHSAEVYVHRSGRTARAHSDGCSIALITPNDTSKFAALCKSFSKENFQRFPLEMSYMPEVMKRLSLARQIDKISRKDSQDKAKKNWLERNAESMGLILEDNDSEEERVNNHKRKKTTSAQLNKLQEELKILLSRPLQPKTFSKRYLAGAGVSPLLQHQLEELAKQKNPNNSGDVKRKKLMVIGQDCVEPLQALRSAGPQAKFNLKGIAEKRKDVNELRRKRKETKKCMREQRRKQKKKLQAGKE
ncbi:PREDICTED: DEAD-box ATP-dependent RNA helicase 13 [Nicotiana attenuata]|uniref:ATP-dependent RNA helicase n=1 Tax=Nicotiana attenuata TaxID=49451 RepID=A0A1J6IJ92_NICAT|nr:PREDICTED: DEAD-box ATP-dependent RNA helicase 13 [Nicotiana attenuata]OIS98938.1 dead-box atp-dependent rna helicase 13 [Nicotiana attenuata]